MVVSTVVEEQQLNSFFFFLVLALPLLPRLLQFQYRKYVQNAAGHQLSYLKTDFLDVLVGRVLSIIGVVRFGQSTAD